MTVKQNQMALSRFRPAGARSRRVLAGILLCLLVAFSARAETQRVAVVVGHNVGAGDRSTLRYAESDAGKFARVLMEVGEVNSANLMLLQGRPLVEIDQALAEVRKQVALAHQSPGTRVVLLFYFSGHSDGESLELGSERLPFGRLKELLLATEADVRLTILDACKSGAAILEKGGKPAAPFAIRLTDELNTSGEVILASSAADEVTLESEEVRGSFFTHHFVSGLRGAADVSGDRRVTLNEAYRYAYDRTVTSSAGTLDGPHHPVYDLKLSGQGELVLSVLEKSGSLLRLPDKFDRALIVQLVHDQVVAELTPASARSVALPPGRYGLRVQQEGKTYAASLELGPGQSLEITWNDLKLLDSPVVAAKGADPVADKTPVVALPVAKSADMSVKVEKPLDARKPGWQLGVTGGITRAFASQLDLSGILRLDLAQGVARGWDFALVGSLGSGQSGDVLEQALQLRVGYLVGAMGDWLGVALGLETGTGLIWQTARGDVSGSSFLFVASGRLVLAFRLSSRATLTLQGELPLGVVRLDEETQVKLLPSALLGISFEL